jgi:putative ABC transport system permease protein
MLSLALRIILHQPLRYFVALLGISVAAGLALIQLGLYRGFRENASVLVDHTAGDVWVCAEFHRNFDFPRPLEYACLEKARATAGVAWAYPLVLTFASWKFADGRTQTVEVVGFDATQAVGGPWAMRAGLPRDLAAPGNVSVDATTRGQLPGTELGTAAEINGIGVRVTAMSDGIQSFQGNPIVFTNLETARAIAELPLDAIHYVIVGLAAGAEAQDVIPRLSAIPHVEAYTRARFSIKAQQYWLESTGAGKALAFAAIMGLLVGVVVAGQVLYTSTLEHLREWGTLKAIGATNAQVTFAIMAQAVSWALPGHLAGGALLWLAMATISGKGIRPALDLHTYLWLGLLTVGVCVTASLLSVVRVMRVEPADVFKG